jgi:ribonuclease inhibitor
MDFVFIDGKKMITEDLLHNELKNKLNFPDYYGCNFDALYDCLTDNFSSEVCIVIYNFLSVFESLQKKSIDMIDVFYSAKINTSNFRLIIIDSEIDDCAIVSEIHRGWEA